MTKASLPILPFPADIDRDHFGHYLSGFVDGEGHFALTVSNSKKTPAACFVIGLRADDLPILRLIQSYFGCGRITLKPDDGKRRDQYFLQISRNGDHVASIVPHFLAFPLRAKKRRDFEIWREGVALVQQVTSIPIVRLGGTHGSLPRWTAERMRRFCSLRDALQAIRQFDAPAVPLPEPLPAEPSLFDLLD